MLTHGKAAEARTCVDKTEFDEQLETVACAVHSLVPDSFDGDAAKEPRHRAGELVTHNKNECSPKCPFVPFVRGCESEKMQTNRDLEKGHAASCRDDGHVER
jgi:hypothetical protein